MLFILISCFLVLLILVNVFLMQSSNDISYFFDRYTPQRNEVLYLDLLLHELKYLIPLLLISSSPLTLIKNPNRHEKMLSQAVLLVVSAALIINTVLYYSFPEAINIHFRIYIIEPLVLFQMSIIVFNHFNKSAKLIYISMVFVSLILPFNLSKFISLIDNDPKNLVSANKSVHFYLFKNNLSDCQCTIYDEGSPVLLSRVSSDIPSSIELEQWENALIHKKNYFKK